MRKAEVVIVSLLLVIGSITGISKVLHELSPSTCNAQDMVIFSTAYSRITDYDNELIIKESIEQADTVREAVYAIIDENPGIHFREICRRLGKENGVMQYHTHVLKHFRKVSTFKDGRYVRYFVNNSRVFDDRGKAIVSAWHRPVEREVLLVPLLERKKKYPFKELLERCGTSRQSLNWHLARMENLGLVTVEMIDGERYVIIDDEVLERLDELIKVQLLKI
ncbi:MAG: winged helix-turn-helix transcriptional regulator [Candidatus Hodarchaeota archaeon]